MNQKAISVDRVGVVIPAYNTSPWIGGVLKGVLRHIPPGRVWVVDDGSSDGTSGTARRFGVRVIRHSVNRGKGEALKTGFRAVLKAGCEAVITLDGDAQHDPDVIPEFIEAMAGTGSDAVLGIRPFRVGRMPLDRIFSNRMSSFLVSAMSGKWIPDSQCGYRMIKTRSLKALRLRTGHYETETEILISLLRKGCRIWFCPVPALRSAGSSSHIRRFRDTVRFLRLLARLTADP
jgi:glycosyltransferase involved in cell wall biosynthesis